LDSLRLPAAPVQWLLDTRGMNRPSIIQTYHRSG